MSLMKGLVLISIGLWGIPQARGELRELYRGARATGMGGAFTGLADDEQALYMNPAGLGGMDKYRLNYVAATLEAPGDVVGTMSLLSGLNGGGADTLNAFMGKNIFTHAQLTPTFVMPNFAVGVIVDQKLAIYAKNLSYPHMTIGYQTTNGVQGAYALSLLRKSRRGNENDLRLGIGAKVLWRRGGYHVMTMTEIFSQIGANSLASLQSLVTGEFGMGIGGDFGLQYVRKLNSRLSLSAGVAWTDIGDVAFTSGSDTIKSNLSSGFAFKYALPGASVIFSYDYRHIADPGDWRTKQHLGLEMGFPLLSFYGGLNQFYPTYGFSLNMWLLKLTAVSYMEELGTLYGQDCERRYLLQLNMSLAL